MAKARALIEGDLDSARSNITARAEANTDAAQAAANPLKALARTLRTRAEQGDPFEIRAAIEGTRNQAQANAGRTRTSGGSLQAQRARLGIMSGLLIAQGTVAASTARQRASASLFELASRNFSAAGELTSNAASRNLQALSSFESTAATALSQARLQEANQASQPNNVVGLLGSGISALSIGGAFSEGGIFAKLFSGDFDEESFMQNLLDRTPG